MNVWTFTGNLGRDAEQRFTGSQQSVVNFSVAVASGYGDRKATTWVKCSMWGKRGEAVLPYLNKGQTVAVSGEACLREYEKKDGGGTGYSMELNVRELTLVGKKEDAPPKQEGFRDTPAAAPADDGFGDSDVPF